MSSPESIAQQDAARAAYRAELNANYGAYGSRLRFTAEAAADLALGPIDQRQDGALQMARYYEAALRAVRAVLALGPVDESLDDDAHEREWRRREQAADDALGLGNARARAAEDHLILSICAEVETAGREPELTGMSDADRLEAFRANHDRHLIANAATGDRDALSELRTANGLA